MRFSIVIPTHNRIEKLKNCLSSLAAQNFDKTLYEVLVIDDGSQDDTLAVLKDIQKDFPVPLYYFSQPNQGQGVARNRGIKEANGEIILFMGDDVVATPQLLEAHDRVHLRHDEESAAVLGFVTWHPDLQITPLMEFMERGGAILGRFGGHQFAYDLLKGKLTADYRFFYTANISLKKYILEHYKFDPWFSTYGWEDIELGYRLTKELNLKIYYEPVAVAYHDHATNSTQWANRMRAIGESVHFIHGKYPELSLFPSPRKRIAFRILSHPLSLRLFNALNRNLYYYALSKKYFLEGFNQAYNK
ncbi:MAG: glycosyltransferase family 2 protein [Patescibacteria group bacterium]